MTKQLVPTAIENKARQADLARAEAAEAHVKKNADFLQLSKSAVPELAALAKKNIRAFDVLMVLVQKMDRQNAIMMSSAAISTVLGISPATFKRAMAVLRADRWVQIVKVGTSNAYLVNSRAFWQSYRTHRVASFNAKIITTGAEQKESMRRLEEVNLKMIPVQLDRPADIEDAMQVSP